MTAEICQIKAVTLRVKTKLDLVSGQKMVLQPVALEISYAGLEKPVKKNLSIKVK